MFSYKESNLLTLVVFIVYYLKLTIAQCPPTKEQLKPIANDLKSWFEPLKKLKPGSNPKDADYIMYKLAKDIFSSKKFLPCNQYFEWSEIEKDAILSREKCYRPQDYSKESVQKEFKECMSNLIPPMAMKYTASSFEACDCFSQKMLPQYQSKWKKVIKSYFDEFKTLKHRKK